MSTWILILTLASTPANGGTAIASVPGFIDKQSCKVAGDEWIASRPYATGFGGASNQKASFACVEQKR